MIIWLPLAASAQPAEGFGNNVPLSIAARQIVPADMLVNIDGSIDSNSRVSWRGGSDWHRVLETMAAQKGATVEYAGQLVRIIPSGTMTASVGLPAPITVTPVQAAPASLNRGGLIVLAPTPPPIAVAPVVPAPVAVTTIPTAPRQGAVTVVPSRADSPSVTVVQPASSIGTPPPGPVVVVQSQTPAPAMQVSVPDQPNLSETSRQRAERLRAERDEKIKADREARIRGLPQGRIDPPIRNAQPTPRQVMTSGVWKATKGETLDQILGDWADKAGWTLAFNSQVFYEIQAGAEFSGDFTEAVASLVRSIRARPVPVATFYKGNKVLVISNNVDGN